MNARTSKKELVVLYLPFCSLLDSINGLPDASIITPEIA